jgi:hypothetical protein
MGFRELLVLYLAIGVGCGLTVLRRAAPPRPRPWGSAALALVLWPVWMPLALGEPGATAHTPVVPAARATAAAAGRAEVANDVERALGRVEQALAGALQVVAGTCFAGLLTARDARQILDQLGRVGVRLAELDRHLALYGAAAEAPLADGAPAPPGSRSAEPCDAAELRGQSLGRLRELRAQGACALGELGDLAELLHTELVLARFRCGSAPNEAAASRQLAELVSELWARLESLDEAAAGC